MYLSLFCSVGLILWFIWEISTQKLHHSIRHRERALVRAHGHITETSRNKKLITRSRLSESICQWMCTSHCSSLVPWHTSSNSGNSSFFYQLFSFDYFFFFFLPFSLRSVSHFHMHSSRARKTIPTFFKWPGAEWFYLSISNRSRQAHTHTMRKQWYINKQALIFRTITFKRLEKSHMKKLM